MRRDELFAMGEEASDLARIVDLGVPVGAVWIVGLSDDAEGRVMAVVSAALALDFAHPVVELRSFFSQLCACSKAPAPFPGTHCFASRRRRAAQRSRALQVARFQ